LPWFRKLVVINFFYFANNPEKIMIKTGIMVEEIFI